MLTSRYVGPQRGEVASWSDKVIYIRLSTFKISSILYKYVIILSSRQFARYWSFGSRCRTCGWISSRRLVMRRPSKRCRLRRNGSLAYTTPGRVLRNSPTIWNRWFSDSVLSRLVCPGEHETGSSQGHSERIRDLLSIVECLFGKEAAFFSSILFSLQSGFAYSA